MREHVTRFSIHSCLGLLFCALGGLWAATNRAAGTEANPAKLPPPILLWPHGAPGARGTEDADKPRLWPFLAPADKATGAAIIICPGGGYRNLATGHEGVEVAHWLNSLGISAFVLQYRLAPYQHPAPMQDAQRAVRWVRAHAAEFHLDPKRIGLMGFSAGGHLASTVGTHFDDGDPQADDPVEKASCRPDCLILCYPVISMSGEYVSQGSKKNLLGGEPDPSLAEFLSNDKQVTPQTPPTFLFHTNEDTGVLPENSVLFYLALRRNHVPAELHIYEHGKHGVGLAPKDSLIKDWPERLAHWLTRRGMLTSMKQP